MTHPVCQARHSVATLELLEQVQDRTWLAKVTNALNQHWQKKDAAKIICPENGSENGNVPPARPSRAGG